METKQPKRNRWLRHTRNVFLAGFLTAIPLVATYLIFKWLFEALDGIFQPVIVFITGHRLPGVGLGGHHIGIRNWFSNSQSGWPKAGSLV